MTDRLFLIDATGFAYRAHHAISRPGTRELTRSDGFPVGALMTFCSMIWKVRRDGIGDALGAPSHMAAVFDTGAPSFRKQIYPAYKGTRKPTPGALTRQLEKMKDATRAFGITAVESPGFEADDVIATYATEAARAGIHVIILSSDKDLMQLLAPPRIMMFDTMKEQLIGDMECLQKFGVPPRQVIDVQAILGDITDNVPGVPGIGVKTAAKIVDVYGDLESALAIAKGFDPGMDYGARAKLRQYDARARLSKRLVTLKRDVPQDYPLGAFRLDGFDPGRAVAFLWSMEFEALVNRVARDCGIRPADIDGIPGVMRVGETLRTDPEAAP